jgi:hypothetical protein
MSTVKTTLAVIIAITLVGTTAIGIGVTPILPLQEHHIQDK